MKSLGVLTAKITVLAASLLYVGWAFSIMWGWFVSPVFSIRELSIPEAVGLILTINIFRAKYQEKSRSEMDDKLERLLFIILTPALALLAGYITLQFI